jgi:phage-related protein
MANASIEIEIKALDKASSKLDALERSLSPINKKVRKMDKEFDKVDKSINRASSSFGKFKGLLAGAVTVGGIAAFGKSVVDASSKAEDLKTALQTVTGSAAEADNAFKFIRDFTETTPFQVDQVAQAFLKLKAAGLEPSIETLTMFGDVAAVTNDKVGALEAITDLYSRTVAGGLGLEELDRLADRGIPVYDILTKKIGITRQEVSEFGKTAEGAAKITQALTEGFNERFGGGMERSADNLSTRFSTLSDTIEGLLIKVGEGGLADAINVAVSKFTDFLKANEDLALSLGEKLGKAVVAVTDGIIFLFENADKAKPIFDLLGLVFKEVVAPAAVLIFDALVKVSEVLKPLIETAIPVAKTLFEGLANIMTNVVIPAFNTVISVIDNIVGKIEFMIDKIGAGINKVKELGGGVADKVGAGFNKAGETIGGWAESVNGWGASVYDEWIGNSYIPDLVKGIGKYMDMLPREMIMPAKRAVEGTNRAFERSPLATLPTSPVSGVGAGVQTATAGMATANMNFNISGINAGQASQFQQAQMRQYIEGVALQVATNVLRQNTRIGGLL